MEEDDFVFVDGDDAVSVSSSRSSLFLVDDPSTDALMLHGEEQSPLKKVASAPPPKEEVQEEPATKAIQSPCVGEGPPPVQEAPKEEVSLVAKYVLPQCCSYHFPREAPGALYSASLRASAR